MKPGGPDSSPVSEATADGPTAALRERGAHLYDPVRMRYIEALARSAEERTGELRQLLDRKLAAAVAAYELDFEAARAPAAETVQQTAARFPEAADALQQLYASGDFRAIRRLRSRLEDGRKATSLGELLEHIDRDAAGTSHRPRAGASRPLGAPPAELKALRDFRSTWAQLSVERQLSRSLARAPVKPGPLNSHSLVLRALKQMQDNSPAYLMRFMSYVETLQALERLGGPDQPQPARVVRRETDRKPKSGRRKPG